jgi:Domain of unknown function (DUF5753)
VQQILNALRVPDEVARDLIDLARTANVHYISHRVAAQTGLWRLQLEIKKLVESSAAVRQFLPVIPSGLLQVEEYARQVFTKDIPGAVSRDMERAVAARMESQSPLRDNSRQFHFLLTEHAVRWRRVALPVMAEQCAHMADVAEASANIEIAVIPQNVEVRASPLNTFVVYDQRMVKVELYSGGVVLRDPKDVEYHLNLFEYFWRHALTGHDAIALLRSISAEFMRELD